MMIKDAPAAGAPPGEPGAEGGEAAAGAPAYTGSSTACHPLLSSMINYAQPVKFQTWENAESKYTFLPFSTFKLYQLLSLSRYNLKKMIL